MKHRIHIILAFLLSAITPLWAQTYSIGDLIVNDDGSKGIVFYVTPDRTDGWMVALNDLPTHNWGLPLDIASLQNLSNPNALLSGTDGLTHTEIIRQYHSDNGYLQPYGAGIVDFEHGWYIPSSGQLMKLCSVLSMISDDLIRAGGSTLDWQPYFTSTESTTSNQIWTVDFGSHSRDWGGSFVSTAKSSEASFRAVRNIRFENTPLPEPSFPDNIIESDCNNNIPFPFQGGQLLHHTQNDINVYTTPLCGDIDNDGIVDIVVPHFTATDDNYRAWSNQIDIYSGDDLSLQSTISIPQEVYLLYHPYGIVRYPSENGGTQGAVFVLCNDGKLRSYSKNGQLLHTADVDPPCDGVPAFADFNNDGYPEVYIGNAIYDAATLKQLCAGPANGNKGLSYRGSPPNVYPHHANYALSFAYNFFGDEKMELVCGNTIYNVNIASRTNPALNSITTNKTITPPNGFPQDGQVSLADLDLDGEIDVVVTKDLTDDCVDDNTYFYAYKPSTGNILFQFSIYCRSAGLPVICNIDSDPHPEILFVDYLRDVYSEKMHCLRYTTGNGLDEIWAVHHNDPSGMTTMVFFDFNNDEIPEIVFRDAYALNIINGSDGNVLYSYPMRSGSACEHAIVADVNNDDHAEILATGLLEEYYGNNGHGSLNLFGHPEWPSARQVWNQYAYNVTNINNDLTVPQLGFDNASIFTDPNGSVRRPYNNFMYQATYITHTGEPYNPNGYYEVEVSGAACSTFTFHGVTYTESGNYEQLIESPDGCDTLYHIAVSIDGTITHEWSQQACNHFVWNGTNYTEPGDYIQDFVSVEGCDSIVTLHLTFSDALEYDVDTAVCQSLWWNGQEYTEAGVYTQQFVDVDGCDSIVHLHLSFAGQPEGIPEIIGLTEVNVGTDLIVGQYYYHIDSIPLATHYEWTLEGADWIMDTTGTNCSLLITTPGTAVLKVKAWNDCGETEQEIVIHAGFFDVDERQAIQVVLYPNPANDKVFVEAEGIKSVKVYNLQGQLLKTWDGEASNRVEISLHNIVAGMYAVEVLTERGSTISKMTVTHKE